MSQPTYLVRQDTDLTAIEGQSVSVSIIEGPPIVKVEEKIKVKVSITQLFCIVNFLKGLIVQTQNEVHDFRSSLVPTLHLLNLKNLYKQLSDRLVDGKDGKFSIQKTQGISFWVQSNGTEITEGQTAYVVRIFRDLIHQSCV